MIPDKIYVHEASAQELDVQIPYSIEYVRKGALIENALDLINAVEKYVRQECSRSTLLSMKDKLKELLEK